MGATLNLHSERANFASTRQNISLGGECGAYSAYTWARHPNPPLQRVRGVGLSAEPQPNCHICAAICATAAQLLFAGSYYLRERNENFSRIIVNVWRVSSSRATGSCSRTATS